MRDNDNSQESKSGGVGIFILFILILFLIAGAAGALYGSRIQEKPKDLSDTSVKSFDLMEESKMARCSLDGQGSCRWRSRYYRTGGRLPLGAGTSADYGCDFYQRGRIRVARHGCLASEPWHCGKIR